MRDWESFIVGMFGGALVLCLIMLNFQAPIRCEVQMGDMNHTHIIYGVAKANE